MHHEGFLQRVQPDRSICFGGQAFDRDNILTSGAFGRIVAGENGLAIHHDRAAAALGFVAADLGAGQPEPVSEQLCQGLAGQRRKADLLIINSKCNILAFYHS